jgi:hypothetical protein
MHRQILFSAAILGLFVVPASAAPTNNPDRGWTCNASGSSSVADGTCVTSTPTEMAIICDPGGMSTEPGGGETCSPAPAAARLKLKHQLAKPGLRRRGR